MEAQLEIIDQEHLQQIERNHKPNPYKAIAIEFIAGSVGAALSVVVGQPMDTVRVRIQNSSQQQSIVSQFTKSIQKDGFFSLFRGMSSPLMGIPILQAINFGTYGSFKQLLDLQEDDKCIKKHFVCGALTGFVQSFIASPLELFKLAVQFDTTCKHSKPPKLNPLIGSIGVAKYIYTNMGIQGIYRGLGVTFLREIPSYGVYFSSYQFIKHHIQNNYQDKFGQNTDTLSSFIGGGLAGVLCWCSTYPFDVIKSRLQMDFEGQKYNNAIDCYKKSLKKEGGYQFLSKGLSATILRAIPVNAILFYGYELTVSFLNNKFDSKNQYC